MKVKDCYLLGEVIKTHGLRGEVTVHLDVDFPDEYETLESVFLLEEERLVPFFIDHIQINGEKAILKFEGIDSIDDAKSFVKSEMYLPLTFLPELKGDAFYYHDLIGCKVYNEDTLIGEVQEVYDMGATQLIEVRNGKEEILVPINDKILKEVNTTDKKLKVSLPDGLLDLYKSNKS